MFLAMIASQPPEPTLEQMDAFARHAMAQLPDLFRVHLADVVLRIEDFPDRDLCRDMALDSPFDLLGLYQGYSTARPSGVSGTLPDTIFLYRRPILEYWAHSGDSLEQVITHVLVHEIGHHFGLSDDDMHRIEASDGE